MSRPTVAAALPLAAGPEALAGDPPSDLMTIRATTTASTTTMLPPAIMPFFRWSARFARACWAAIFSLALS